MCIGKAKWYLVFKQAYCLILLAAKVYSMDSQRHYFLVLMVSSVSETPTENKYLTLYRI